jgi:hypothetical protein
MMKASNIFRTIVVKALLRAGRSRVSRPYEVNEKKKFFHFVGS